MGEKEEEMAKVRKVVVDVDGEYMRAVKNSRI